jgi:hypothetical protein
MMMNDPRQYAPATLRNRDLILGILRDVLPTKASSSKSQAARGSMSFILPEISRISFSHLPIREPDALQSVAAWVKATRMCARWTPRPPGRQ